MKLILNQSGKILMLMFAAIMLITSCKKDEEKLDPPRLFKASDIKIEVIDSKRLRQVVEHSA